MPKRLTIHLRSPTSFGRCVSKLDPRARNFTLPLVANRQVEQRSDGSVQAVTFRKPGARVARLPRVHQVPRLPKKRLGERTIRGGSLSRVRWTYSRQREQGGDRERAGW